MNRATAKSNDDLVFITHRIPYPPFKGEKSRSWNFLRRFVELGPVHLASFVDDPADLEHVSFLEELCESCLLLPLLPTARRINSLRGLLTRNALTVQYYRDPRLSRWLRQIQHRHAPKRVYVQGSGVAEYCLDPSWGAARRVLDMIDIDSDKWRQYADRCVTPPSRWIYRRESKKLLEFERRAAATYDVTVFVSEAETRLFQQLAPDAAAVLCIRQGVDSVYFSPHDPPPSPFADDAVPIVFTGTMNYWPNVDAVTGFATEVLPAIRRDYPDATFNIVGARPTRDVQQLAQQPGVLVTGRVPDVRPYLAHARVVVAPLRIARGIQSKVLEAMSMARPVVVTPMALEGIQAKHGRDLLCAEQPADVAKAVTSIFSGGHLEMGRLARELVIGEYNWDASFALLQSALEPT